MTTNPTAGTDGRAANRPLAFTIREDDLRSPATQDLLLAHVRQLRAQSPAGSSFALDLDAMRSSDLTVWSAWVDTHIAAVGALRDLGQGHGEVKSMRTHRDWLRKGAGSAILDHIIRTAAERGMTVLSLETGSGPDFDAAIALYRSRGFEFGGPFGEYRPSAFNRFLHLEL